MKKGVICAMVLLLLCGCDQQKLIQKFVLPAQDKAGRAYIEDVRTGSFSPVRAATAPAYQNAMTAGLFHNMQAIFGARPVKGVIVVGAHIFEGGGTTTNALTYEYDMGDRFVLAEITLQDIGGTMRIDGIHMQALSRSLEQMNAFTLAGKNPLLLAVLALVVLIPIFIVATAIVCWRTPIPRFKWLWRIFVLLGITGITLNWTSGDVRFVLLQVNLLGAAFSQQLYGPWILQIGVPLGAILFWIRRHRWLERAEETT